MLKKNLLYAAVLFLALLLVGCGGGGGGSDDTSSAPAPKAEFKVVSVSPADGATGVALNSIMTAALDDEIDPASISGAFSVVQGSSVSGPVSMVGNNGVKFVPDRNFQALSSVVIVLSGLKNKSGMTMKPFAWMFTTGTVPDTQAPTVPTNLVATVASQTQVNLTWTASADVVGCKIFRNTVQVGTSATNSFSDTGLTAATAYSYTISACDASGNCSAQTAAVTATTQAPPPDPNFTTVATFTVASLSLLPKNSPTVATFEPATGKWSVLKAGNPWDASLSDSPISTVAGEDLYVSIGCAFDSALPIYIEVKKAVNPTGAYASKQAFCLDGMLKAILKPNQTDPAARVSFNIGEKIASGLFTGTVLIQKRVTQ